MTDIEKLTIESDGDITLCVKNPTNKLDIVEVVHDAFVASLGHENLGTVAAEILRLREYVSELDAANRKVSDANEALREEVKMLRKQLERYDPTKILGDPRIGVGFDIAEGWPTPKQLEQIRAAAAALKETGDEN